MGARSNGTLPAGVRIIPRDTKDRTFINARSMKHTRKNKTKRPYRQSRSFDASCRCNGSCAYCGRGRFRKILRRLDPGSSLRVKGLRMKRPGTWEYAVHLLEIQGLNPQPGDKEHWEQGFVSHIMFPKR